MTWQPGKFPPPLPPLAPGAFSCVQRVSYWAHRQGRKQVGLGPVDAPAGSWHRAVKPSGQQNCGQCSLYPVRPLSPPQAGGVGRGGTSRTQPPSLRPLHPPTSLLPDSQDK